MPLIGKSKPSITKWLEKSERSICSYTQAGVQEIIMRNKGKRRREKEINLKVKKYKITARLCLEVCHIFLSFLHNFFPLTFDFVVFCSALKNLIYGE